MIACSFVNDKVKEWLGHLIIIAAPENLHEIIRALAQYKKAEHIPESAFQHRLCVATFCWTSPLLCYPISPHCIIPFIIV